MVDAPANPFKPFDASDFTAGATAKRPHAPLAMVREVAEANNYPSRWRRGRGGAAIGRAEPSS
jgi:hypothetical protein